MKRIIYHWTGGAYRPNQTDLLHYHFIIDDQGKCHEGVYAVKDNENCLDGVYAAHTGGGNTGSIGIAFSGMFGYISPFQLGRFPLTGIQMEAGFKKGAELVKKYNLNIDDPMTIQTHYGFGKRNPNTASKGKIDIVYMPPYPKIKADEVEAFIRNKVKWYLQHI